MGLDSVGGGRCPLLRGSASGPLPTGAAVPAPKPQQLTLSPDIVICALGAHGPSREPLGQRDMWNPQRRERAGWGWGCEPRCDVAS